MTMTLYTRALSTQSCFFSAQTSHRTERPRTTSCPATPYKASKTPPGSHSPQPTHPYRPLPLSTVRQMIQHLPCPRNPGEFIVCTKSRITGTKFEIFQVGLQNVNSLVGGLFEPLCSSHPSFFHIPLGLINVNALSRICTTSQVGACCVLWFQTTNTVSIQLV